MNQWCWELSAIIEEALEREAGLLLVKNRILRNRIKRFERKYSMTSEEFRERFESGELGDDEEYFLWWSLLEALTSVEKRLRDVERELQKFQ